MNTGQRLRVLRHELGISLRELARRSGVSVAHLSRLERGLQEPTTGMLWTIAEALEVHVVDLVVDPDGSLREAVIANTLALSESQLEQVDDLIHELVLVPAANAKPARKRRRPMRTKGPERSQ